MDLSAGANVLQLWQWSESSSRRWNFEHISDDVGGEVAETVEDQAKKHRLVARALDTSLSNPAILNPPYACPSMPGTYRIASVAAQGNVIEVSPHNETRAVCSRWKNEPHQQWIIQYSGRGYKIKNVKHGVYLAAASGEMHTVIGTSPEPTNWNLMRTHAGFAIQYGDEDGVVDLYRGLDTPWNVLQLWKWADTDDRRRSFVHISDDVGDEVADTVEDQVKTLREQMHTQATAHYFEKLALEKQLAELRQRIEGSGHLSRVELSNPDTKNHIMRAEEV